MRVLYLDCGMGAAGDMLTAALLELLPDKKQFVEKINALGLPGVEVKYEKVSRCGILGTHMNVTVNGMREDGHHHSGESERHGHHHGGECEGHGHHHASLGEIHQIINRTEASGKVKKDACAVYDLIADAESKAHGVPVGEVHFHEVGAMDAVADVMAVCMLIEALAPDRIIASPVNTGFGSVRCAHGIMPVPAPATAGILEGIPVYAGQYEGEMCTPTGAALLKYFADSFGRMPLMNMERTGYGMGTKEFPQANCLRAILGNGGESGSFKGPYDEIVELTCCIDDMTGEGLACAAEIIRGKGALDVFFVPIQMKKGRPGQMLVCLSRPEKADEMAACILKHTTTLGVRRTDHARYILDRKITVEETPYGSIRVKHGEGYGVSKSKPEYEDLAEAADRNGVTLEDVRNSMNARL